jgi:hypothetical protein
MNSAIRTFRQMLGTVAIATVALTGHMIPARAVGHGIALPDTLVSALLIRPIASQRSGNSFLRPGAQVQQTLAQGRGEEG